MVTDGAVTMVTCDALVFFIHINCGILGFLIRLGLFPLRVFVAYGFLSFSDKCERDEAPLVPDRLNF